MSCTLHYLNPPRQDFPVDAFATRKAYILSACRLIAALVACALLTYGCAGPQPAHRPPGHTRPYKVNGRWYQPISTAANFREIGVASWYGKKFHGRKTSNGETYNMYGMTAAHKTLPLGTHVRVKNLSNRKQIHVRINDRGPFIRGRIIDLSYTAAKKLGIVGPGTAKVEVSVLASRISGKSRTRPGSSVPQISFDTGSFSFQIGAFKNRENAEKQKRHLAKTYKHVTIARVTTTDGILYRVRVGKFSSLNQARVQEKILIRNGYPDAFIVAD